MTEHEKLSVTVVIPNRNGIGLLKKHLPRVLAASGDSEIILADDASSDGSVRFVAENFPNVKIVVGKRNQGFAGTANAGVREASGDIVVLLNTDVEPVSGFLKYILPHFTDNRVFAVGCMDRSHENGKIVFRGRGVARWKNGFYRHSRGETDKSDTAWVSGGSGAFRKSIWDKIGGMDASYNPFYWEDIDISYRARKSGFKVVFEPQSIVDHYHEQGAIKSMFSKGYVMSVAFRNELYFHWKNITDVSLFSEHLASLLKHLARSLFPPRPDVWRGFLMALFRLPSVIYERLGNRNRYVLPDRGMDVF